MNIEQIKQVLEGAPEQSTHYIDGDYWTITEVECDRWDGEYWVDSGDLMEYKDEINNLDDLATILAQHEEIERLCEENDRLKSGYGDNWYDGFIAARDISRDRFSDLESMDDSEILGLSENAEQLKSQPPKEQRK